jgi:hypothetical protein
VPRRKKHAVRPAVREVAIAEMWPMTRRLRHEFAQKPNEGIPINEKPPLRRQLEAAKRGVTRIQKETSRIVFNCAARRRGLTRRAAVA